MTDFRKILTNLEGKIRPVWPSCSTRTDGQTDRRTGMTKLIVVFLTFAKAPKTAKIQSEYKNFVPPEEHIALRLGRTTREGNRHFFGTYATQKYTVWGKLESFFFLHMAVQILTTRLQRVNNISS